MNKDLGYRSILINPGYPDIRSMSLTIKRINLESKKYSNEAIWLNFVSSTNLQGLSFRKPSRKEYNNLILQRGASDLLELFLNQSQLLLVLLLKPNEAPICISLSFN